MSRHQLVVIFSPPLFILILVAAASVHLQLDPSILTRDIASIAEVHPLTGFVSNVGALLWCAAASVCFFAAAILRNSGSNGAYRFLLSSGCLSAYLLFDDFFQLHEELASMYLGLDEKIIFLILGIAVALYLVSFRLIILKTNFGALLLAIALLAASVAIDTVLDPWMWRFGDWRYFFEDAPKFLGVACWCGYFVHTASELLAENNYTSNTAG